MTSERFDQILEILKQNGGSVWTQTDQEIQEILLQNGVPLEEIPEFLEIAMKGVVDYYHENSLGPDD